MMSVQSEGAKIDLDKKLDNLEEKRELKKNIEKKRSLNSRHTLPL